MANAMARVVYHARIGWHVCAAIFKIGVLFKFFNQERQREEIRLWSLRALTLFGLRPHTVGLEHQTPGPCLYVSNHISWLDVVLIQSQVPTQFVAKSEVRGWPVFGWIAHQLGTVFVQRNRITGIAEQIRTVASRLAGGQSVCIFPEGTTTHGSQVLPFRPALFEAALRTGVAVHPVAIRYVRTDGTRAVETAFTADMSLIQSFRTLISLRDARAEIAFLPRLATPGMSRTELAQASQQAIAYMLETPDVVDIESRANAEKVAVAA